MLFSYPSSSPYVLKDKKIVPIYLTPKFWKGFAILAFVLFLFINRSSGGDVSKDAHRARSAGLRRTDESDKGTKLEFGPGLSLKLMTFNLRYASASDGFNSWKFRKTHLVDLINRYHPAVMGTQEGLADQLSEIHSNLNWTYHRFGVEREQNGEFEQIFYDTDIVSFVKGGNFWLSDTPDVAGKKDWDAPCVRMVTWCLFELKNVPNPEKNRFLFVNTQFDHMSEMSRNKSALLLHDKVKEFNPTNFPVFIVGDFNTYRYTETYKFLVGENNKYVPSEGESPVINPQHTQNGPNLFDAWMETERKNQIGDISYTYHGWDGKYKREEVGAKRAENHIDWILFKPKMKVLKTEVVTETRRDGRYPSDHYPIQTEIIFPTRK